MYEDGLVKLKKIWDESAVASVKQQKTTLEKKVSGLVKDTQKALKKVQQHQILWCLDFFGHIHTFKTFL